MNRLPTKGDKMNKPTDRIYPCEDCGKLRSADEGGANFSNIKGVYEGEE